MDTYKIKGRNTLAMEEKFPDVDFGNKGNGFLNIKNIQEYYAKLK